MTYQAFSRFPTPAALYETPSDSSAASVFACRVDLPSPSAFARTAGIAIVVSLGLAAAVAAAAGSGLIAVDGTFMTLFWVEAERNFPTFLNFALLAIAFCLLAPIALRAWSGESEWRWHWMILSAVFLLLAFDEAARMHEMLGGLGRQVVTAEGIFRFAWVAVALPLVAVFALGFLRFLMALPRRTAALMLASGMAYVGGALGLEMVNGALFDAAGDHRNAAYAFFTLLEESLEMGGITLFCVSLLTYLSDRSRPI